MVYAFKEPELITERGYLETLAQKRNWINCKGDKIKIRSLNFVCLWYCGVSLGLNRQSWSPLHSLPPGRQLVCMCVLGLWCLSPLPGLCHCFALPPCVQHQNHTQAKERKPFALAVTVNDCTTGRWRQKCARRRDASSRWQLSEQGPPKSFSGTQTVGVATQRNREASTGNHFVLRFLHQAFLASFSWGMEK